MSESGDGGDCGPGVRTSAGQPAALLHLAVDDMSSVKIRLVVKNILCPRRPGPRCSPPAEDVGPGRRVVRRRVQSIPILCKWKVSKGAAGGRYLCGDNAAPCAAQHQTMGLLNTEMGTVAAFADTQIIFLFVFCVLYRVELTIS